MDAVCSGYSGIVVYGGGDIVFGTKKSNQWMQWMQWNSGIWWLGHCLLYKKVKPVEAVGSGCSGIVIYGGWDIVIGAKRSNQWIQWMQSQSGHST